MKTIFTIIVLFCWPVLSSELEDLGFEYPRALKKTVKLESKVKKITDQFPPDEHNVIHEYFIHPEKGLQRRNLFKEIKNKGLLSTTIRWNDEAQSVLKIMDNYALIDSIAKIDVDLNILDQMKKKAKLRHHDEDEEITLKKTFWKKIAGFIQNQEPIRQGPTEKKYFNVIKFLTQRQNPNLAVGDEDIHDYFWEQLEIDVNTLASSSGLGRKDLIGLNLQIDEVPINLINAWFFQLMRCRQAMKIDENGDDLQPIPAGVKYIRNRTKAIVTYLCYLEMRGEYGKIKELIKNNILENATDCPDAALIGLESFELGIKLENAGSDVYQAFGAIVQDYKKEIIESILEPGYESREEYLYLLLLFNHPLGLGLTFTQMHHQNLGARKTFDQALDLILQNLVYENIILALSLKKSWQEVLTRFVPECGAAKSLRDDHLDDLKNLTKNENIYKEVLKKHTQYIFDEVFTSPSQYLNFPPEKISTMQRLLN